VILPVARRETLIVAMIPGGVRHLKPKPQSLNRHRIEFGAPVEALTLRGYLPK
jgi:hypothetical protein